jgi:hypothetical protein
MTETRNLKIFMMFGSKEKQIISSLSLSNFYFNLSIVTTILNVLTKIKSQFQPKILHLYDGKKLSLSEIIDLLHETGVFMSSSDFRMFIWVLYTMI